ncbi:MAG TPA: hypothetical protein VLB86_16740 [Gaiellaceae bacterium]|nr:hypothetical protein [Gaiellaceae bacterium]
MAVDAATPAAAAPLRAHALSRIAALPARTVLGGIVAISFAARWLLAAAHSTPYYFPDEYIYPTLAHSLASGGRPAVRGEATAFPALLEPLLTAPFWLLGDPYAAYVLTQGLHALAMSLAAVPVYLLARRLRLSNWVALGAALVAVTAPALTYVGYMLADPVAYPLVLAAVAAGVAALDRPTRSSQLAFLGLAGIATFARVQYVVLPALFLVAALVVEGFRVRTAARRFRTTLVALGVPALAVGTVGLQRVLGYYENVTSLNLPVVRLARWAGSDAMVLSYAAGWVLVPGALLGLALMLARPSSRAERGFAALTVLLGSTLLFQAALFSANSDDATARVHERYTMALVPLLALAFLVLARRGFPWRRALAVLALAMLALSARVPLSGYTVAQGKDDSPTLRAVLRLEQELGIGTGSLVVAALAAGLSLVAIAVAWRRLTVVALAAAVLTTSAIGAGALSYDRLNAASLRATQPADRSWVDAAGLGDVTFVQLPEGDRAKVFEQLFWNRSVDRLVLVNAPPVDAFATERAELADDGRLLVDGRPLATPMLVQTWGSYALWDGVRRVGRAQSLDLLAPVGTPRLRLLAAGLYEDGWLRRNGSILVWPRAGRPYHARLRLRLAMPADSQRVTLQLRAPGYRQDVTLEPGERRTVDVPVRADRKAWVLDFATDGPGWLGDHRSVSVRAEPPLLLPAGPPARARPLA